MKLFFDDRQAAHAPTREFHNGGWTPYAETPARTAQIVAAIGAVTPPRDHGMAPIAAVHDERYLAFLREAWAAWVAAGRVGDAIGYTFPVVRRRPLDLTRIDARLGAFSMDASTGLNAHGNTIFLLWWR